MVPAPNAAYDMTTGTSVAAAHVSGVVALILERKPNLDPEAVRAILQSSAKDLGPSGKDEQFGAGLTDAYQAVLALEEAPREAAKAMGQAVPGQ
jgi:subtilisin family serine protease